jgi:hypothetical protein
VNGGGNGRITSGMNRRNIAISIADIVPTQFLPLSSSDVSRDTSTRRRRLHHLSSEALPDRRRVA